MKKVLLTLCVAASLAACKKDDCAREDFIGTWTGTEKCDLENAVDVTINITAGSASDEVIIDGGRFIDEVVEVDGCDLDGGTTVLGIGTKITGSLEEGKLTLSFDNDAGLISVGCDYNLTKK
ncbi:MAG: hypothetical protein U0V54_11015 [Saprospiraceae bacterium]|nr:hypothetical protein [Saprospiraceae bacterium]